MSPRQFCIATAAALALVNGCASSDSDPSSTRGPSSSPGSSTPSAEACPAGLDDALHASEDAGFSGVVTVVHAEAQCSQGVALRDRVASEPMTLDTVFAIGSVSKSVTAAGTLRLVADGKVALATRAGEVVADLTGPVAGVTIEQLMSHTSGILGGAGPDHQPLSRKEAIAAISVLPQDFEPGSEYGYTNAGFTLLALVIDTITGDYRIVGHVHHRASRHEPDRQRDPALAWRNHRRRDRHPGRRPDPRCSVRPRARNQGGPARPGVRTLVAG